MELKNQIEVDLKTALLERDVLRVSTLRGLKSSIKNAEIAKKGELSEDELVVLLRKEMKQRQESADLYKQGGAQDRADKELKEKAIIQAYLPPSLSDEEVEKFINEGIEQAGGLSQQTMGRIIGYVNSQAKGRVDGAQVAAKVREKLTQQ